MGFTNTNGAVWASSADTVSVTLSGVNVLAGDLVTVLVGWGEDGLTTDVTDGTTTFTPAGLNTGGPWLHANLQFFYLLSSVATGLPTYTFTATGCVFPMIFVWVWTPTATPIFDDQVYSAGVGFGGSASVDTGNLTTSGSDELVIAGALNENSSTPWSSYLIGGGAPDAQFEFFSSTFTIGSWFKSITGTVNGTVTLNSAQKWIANAISFKLPPVGGGGAGGLVENGGLAHGSLIRGGRLKI